MANTWGCWNTPRMDTYVVRDGYVTLRPSPQLPPLEAQILRTIADTSSKECRYDRRRGDHKCAGCHKP